jgi:hypothetical protein
MIARSMYCALTAAIAPCAVLAQESASDAPHPSADRTIALDSPGDAIFWERGDDLVGHHELTGAYRFEQILEANGWEKVGSTLQTPPSQAISFPFPPNEYRERSIGYYFSPDEQRSAVFELVRHSSRLPSGGYQFDKLSLRLIFSSDGEPVAIESRRLEDEHLPWGLEDRFSQ